jgi:DNA replication and repair protein RecF
MWIQSLSLTDIRSYEQLDCPFSQGITAFVGRNGQGKTNIVEAIGYLATLSSHRVASDLPLVRQGSDRGFIRANVSSADRDVLVEIAITPGKANKARINKSPVPRTRDILGIVRAVVFAPEDLELVKGDPSARRRFIDELLVQRIPRLAGTRADYDRVLKQRNALLKSASVARKAGTERIVQTLEVWDEQLALHGGELIAARISLLNELMPLAQQQYAMVSGSDTDMVLNARYQSSLGDEAELSTDREQWSAQLLSAIADRRKDELDRGVTLVGPHRDDIALQLGDFPAKGYVSHGESWSLALSLRLGAFDLLTADGDSPILILDDVFAELDAQRRAHLATHVGTAQQAFITAAVAEDVPAELAGTRIEVVKGGVSHG